MKAGLRREQESARYGEMVWMRGGKGKEKGKGSLALRGTTGLLTLQNGEPAHRRSIRSYLRCDHVPEEGSALQGEQNSQEGDSSHPHLGGNMASNHDKDSNKDSKNSNNKGDTSNRGFASMDDDKQREIASKGGKAAHERGTAHEFDSEEAREAGRKGGEAVSQDREHMSEIGRKGGENSHGGSHEQHAKGGSQSHKNEGSGSGSGSHSRGGNSEQHAEAGRQSHKNR